MIAVAHTPEAPALAPRDRTFLEGVPFADNAYGAIVQTHYPGAHDREYRRRVRQLTRLSEAAWPQLPRYDYTSAEHETWRFVSQVLYPLQDRYSCSAFLEGRERLRLPMDRVPQLRDVSATLEATTGCLLAPVGGLLDSGEFLPMLRHKVMRCTPYIRHASYPFFTPEPDIIHELRGHATMFMHAPFVELSVGIGKAARAAVDAGNRQLLDLIGLFYWYTVEYGLILERGEPKIFGAGNNAGIQDMLRSVDPAIPHKPLSIDALSELSIDYDAPQQVFFVAEAFEQLTELTRQLESMAAA